MPLIRKCTDSAIYASSVAETGWKTCRYAWECLHDSFATDRTETMELSGPGFSVSLVNGPLSDEIWETLPIQDHVIRKISPEDVLLFKNAFEYLVNEHGTLVADKLGFLKAVALVELQDAFKGKATCVTSVSIPALPFCSFFSKKALVHIPPKTLTAEPAISFFAENMYHEMVHQQVTLNLLENELLHPGYDAAASPKITIPWREDDNSNRMRHWELDRVLHAFSVYVALLPYRAAEVERNPDTAQSAYFDQALSCALFLGETLYLQKDLLTPLGEEYLAQLWLTVQAHGAEGRSP